MINLEHKNWKYFLGLIAVPLILGSIVGLSEHHEETVAVGPAKTVDIDPYEGIDPMGNINDDLSGSGSIESSAQLSDVTRRSDERLAHARGITVDEMLDPSRHYGYTPQDRVFLQQQGVSEAEARASEREMCAAGIDC